MQKTFSQKSISLVLLSYNERENLKALLTEIPFSLFDQYFAVDGGSKDGTLDVYRDNHIPVYIQENRGRGNAFLLAQKYIQSDYVIFFSTDGNENPEDLKIMKEFLFAGYDMVVAGRYLYEASRTDNSDDPLRIRKWAGIFGGYLIKLLWGSPIKDAINGFRGFKVSSLQRMQLNAPSHEIELQSTIRAAKLKMQVKEFPTKELVRKFEARKKSASTWRLLFNLGRFLLKEIKTGNKF